MLRSTRSQIDSKTNSEPASSTAYSSGPTSSSDNTAPHQHQPLDLARFALFHGLSKSELDSVSPLLQPRFLGVGQTFIEQGRSGTGLFFLQQGAVKVCRAPVCSKEQVPDWEQGGTILALCGPGETLGEIDAADGSGHTASVITLEPSHFLWMDVGDFKRCRSRLPQVEANLSLLLTARVRRLTAYHSALDALPLPGKIAYSLLLLGQCYGEPRDGNAILLPLRLTQEELAALVGSSREATNRILASFKREGYIIVEDNGYLLIQEPQALQEYCPHDLPSS